MPLKMGSTLNYFTAYHPQMNRQTERVNQCLETYLRCMVGAKLKDWSKWWGLAEWWCNTTFHASIKPTPYEAVYGQIPLFHLLYVAGDSSIDSVDRISRLGKLLSIYSTSTYPERNPK